MDRCALFVDAGYALADGAMAVHGTRRRDSVSWDHAGLLKLLAGLARDRTGLPVLRCYWYEAADGGRTAEHDALAEMPGLKLRLVNTRPGRREGIESQLRRDVVTLAKSGAIADAFIASADEHLAEIVAEVQDLGLRVVVLHIASDGGWTIPQPLRQECDDIVEISGVHLRPFVDLIRGAEPAPAEEQHAAAGYGSRSFAGDDAEASAAMSRAGVPAQALPAPTGAYQAAAGPEYGAAQPYANDVQAQAGAAAYGSAGAASGSAGADQALMAVRGPESGRGPGQFDPQRGGHVNGVGAAPGSRGDGSPQAGDQANYQPADYQRPGSYAQPASTGFGGNEGPAAGHGQAGGNGAGAAGTGTGGSAAPAQGASGQHEAHGGTGQHEARSGTGQHEARAGAGQHAAQGGAGQFPAQGTSAFGYGGGAAHEHGSAQFPGAAYGAGVQQHAGTPHHAGQPQHAAADRGAPQHASQGQGMHASHGAGAPQGSGAYAPGGAVPANAAAGPAHDGGAGPAGGPNQASAAQPVGTGFPDPVGSGMHAQGGGYQNGIVHGPGQPGRAHNGMPQNGSAQNGHYGTGQDGPAAGGYQDGGYPGAPVPGQTSSVHQLSGLSFPPGSAASAQNGYPGGQSGSGHSSSGHSSSGHSGSGQSGSGQSGNGAGGYQYSAGENGTGVHPAPGYQNGSAQNAPAQYPSFNGFQAGGIQNGGQVNQANGGRRGMNPAGFEAAPVQAQPSPYGPISPGYFGGQPAPGEQAAHGGSGQHSMPGAHAAPPAGPSFQPHPPHAHALPQQAQPQAQQVQAPSLPAVRASQPVAVSLPEAVKAAHSEGYTFGESVGRDAPGLWLEAVLARKPRMPSDLEARLLQGSVLPIDSLLHDEVRHSLRRGFWDALESARR